MITSLQIIVQAAQFTGLGPASAMREYYRLHFHVGEVSAKPRIVLTYRGDFFCTDGRAYGTGLDALTAYRNWAVNSYPASQVYARANWVPNRVTLRRS